jgi:DNA-directed RNA polymerase subunit alpha
VSYAAALAQTHFQYFVDFGGHAASDEPLGQEIAGVESARLQELFAREVTDIGLSNRCVNTLRNIHVKTFGDIVRLTPRQIDHIKGFGRVSLRELLGILDSHQLKLGMRYRIDGNKLYVFDWGTPNDVVAANAKVGEDAAEVAENAAS